MLRVFKASGEETLAVEFQGFVEMIGACGEPVRALDLKRHLHGLCGQPRFRQRLVLPDGQILPDDAALEGPVDVQLILLPFIERSLYGFQQLCDAARENDLPAVEQLLQRPQDPNLESPGPLFHAAAHGSAEGVRLLLEASADKDRTDKLRTTPLFIASFSGHVKVVRLLLEAKADKEKADIHGRSPMYTACSRGHAKIVRLLLEAKADKDRTDSFRVSPIRAASLKGRVEVVRLLLEAKADKDKADSYGATPMSVAHDCGHTEVVQLLRGASSELDVEAQQRCTKIILL